MEKRLYRGKSIETGEWVYGQRLSVKEPLGKEFIITDDNIIKESEISYGLNIDAFVAVDPETVSEYTTVNAKNGDKIFEGDVVECCSYNEYFYNSTGPMEVFRRKMTVVWHNGNWKLKESYGGILSPNYWDIIYDGDVEVIGNIYDNPELAVSASFLSQYTQK